VVKEVKCSLVINTERATSTGDAQAEITKQIAARRGLLTQDRDKLERYYAQQARSLASRLAQSAYGILSKSSATLRYSRNVFVSPKPSSPPSAA
jgi:hypothetical protein